MLRDKLISGLLDSALQQRLLTKRNITFQEAENEALAAEAAYKNSQQMHIPTATTYKLESPKSTFLKPQLQAQKHTTENKCYRCGAASHKANRCKFVNEICRFCHKRGHLERVCLSKSRLNNTARVSTASATTIVKQKQPNYRKNFQTTANEIMNHPTKTDEQPTTATTAEYFTLHHTISTFIKPIHLSLTINGEEANMELDSGCAFSLMNDKEFQRISAKNPLPLQPCQSELHTWNQAKLKVLGEALVNVAYNNCTATLPLLIAEGNGISLLGRNWFSHLGIQITGINSVTVQLEELLSKYESLFQEKLGEANAPPIHIDIESTAEPIFLKCRTVPFALRPKLEEAIEKLIAQGILEPTPNSAWATPIVPILKKNGELRICGDYKCTVNRASKNVVYPLPTVKEVLSSLAGATIFSKLDLAQAYQQLRVDEESAKLLTITTPKGLLKVNRLPFGINSAPSIFQRYMDSLFVDMDGVKPYLDDILITGKNEQEHLSRLSKVFERLSNAGLRVNKQKCIFAAKELEFLGFNLIPQGIVPSETKIKAITLAPVPTNKTELRAFLGLLNFYADFIPNRATLLEPLHRLLDNAAPFTWNATHEKAFNNAKEILASPRILAHYDPSKSLVLSCDASPYGVGAVLAHVEDDGKEHPIAYFSRTLAPAERNYAQIDKEALAIIASVCKFHQYLYGRYFLICTDHKPLLGLLQNSKPIPQVLSPRMLRWTLLLGAYNYELKYRPANSMCHADALSRLPIPLGDNALQIPPPGDVFSIETDNPEIPLNAKHIASLTVKDPILSRVKRWVLTGFPPHSPEPQFKPYFDRRHELSMHRGCLLYSNRVVIPKATQADVLQMLHSTHQGMVLSKSLARSYVWWPSLDKDIEEFTRHCTYCQQKQKLPNHAPPLAWDKTSRPWSRIHIDFSGPFRNKYLLILVDAHSKWVEVKIVNKIDSQSVIPVLRDLFATHGLPDILVTDNAKAFTSHDFESFATSNAIKHITSPPYHPSSNGQVERTVQTVKQSLRGLTQGDMQLNIARFLLRQHITPHTSTGYSPSEVLMNRRLHSLLDNLHPDTFVMKTSEQEKMQKLNTALPQIRTFDIDEPVFVRNFATGPRWIAGWITEHTGPVAYKIRTEDGSTFYRHIDHVRARTELSATNTDFDSG